jgi:hypothetical protein
LKKLGKLLEVRSKLARTGIKMVTLEDRPSTAERERSI